MEKLTKKVLESIKERSDKDEHLYLEVAEEFFQETVLEEPYIGLDPKTIGLKGEEKISQIVETYALATQLLDGDKEKLKLCYQTPSKEREKTIRLLQAIGKHQDYTRFGKDIIQGLELELRIAELTVAEAAKYYKQKKTK